MGKTISIRKSEKRLYQPYVRIIDDRGEGYYWNHCSYEDKIVAKKQMHKMSKEYKNKNYKQLFIGLHSWIDGTKLGDDWKEKNEEFEITKSAEADIKP